MTNRYHRLECYKSLFEDTYEKFDFETLEKAEDFIRTHKLIDKYERIRIGHIVDESNTARVINYKIIKNGYDYDK